MDTYNNENSKNVDDSMETNAEYLSEIYERQSRRYCKNHNSENEVK